jgi:hypothetical protein
MIITSLRMAPVDLIERKDLRLAHTVRANCSRMAGYKDNAGALQKKRMGTLAIRTNERDAERKKMLKESETSERVSITPLSGQTEFFSSGISGLRHIY